MDVKVKFGWYVMVESFSLRRMDGNLAWRSDFRHTDKIRYLMVRDKVRHKTSVNKAKAQSAKQSIGIMIDDVNSPLFRFFLSQEGGSSGQIRGRAEEQKSRSPRNIRERSLA
ncbi:unnamed protein product [Prunus armeniaca]|uniref:Uncharacterized protein n=1 Tax=Prunus armeniaca TaxID=36596 RepID=A0A6J5XKN2_PRUAR|nr:unnamed protein product [Prunus armeniaca]